MIDSYKQLIFAILFGIIFILTTFNEEEKLAIILLGASIISGVAYILIEAFSLQNY